MDSRLLEMSAMSKAIHKWPGHATQLAQSFSYNQIVSKQRLCEMIELRAPQTSITFLGGWFCTLPPMMLDGDRMIVSVDIDPICEQIHLHKNVRYVTADVQYYTPTTQVVVNSSFEHMTDDVLDSSFSRMNPAQQIFVMSNNMTFVEDHINCSETVDHFGQKISTWMDVEEIVTVPLRKGYQRYIAVGHKK